MNKDNEYLEEPVKRLLLWMTLSRLSDLFSKDRIHACVFDDKREAILIPMMDFYRDNLGFFPRNIRLSTYRYCYDNEVKDLVPEVLEVGIQGQSLQTYDYNLTYNKMLDYFNEQKMLTVQAKQHVDYMLAQLKTPAAHGFFSFFKEPESVYTYLAKAEPKNTVSSFVYCQGNLMLTSVITKLPHSVHFNAESLARIPCVPLS